MVGTWRYPCVTQVNGADTEKRDRASGDLLTAPQLHNSRAQYCNRLSQAARRTGLARTRQIAGGGGEFAYRLCTYDPLNAVAKLAKRERTHRVRFSQTSKSPLSIAVGRTSVPRNRVLGRTVCRHLQSVDAIYRVRKRQVENRLRLASTTSGTQHAARQPTGMAHCSAEFYGERRTQSR